ncbi:uncharacterized protein [Nicotiana tomentosiformis]|uniref:uncharacterized protein n=1 Tax=Nicotiana tomentosiformis TaxID=4098 RepID=UPI00388CAB6D
MVDSKSVITQVQELQVIIHDLLSEGLVINEAFQVAAMIEKLSPLWKDFKNYLKHKRKKMSLEDLIVWLRIEEDNKVAERRGRGNLTIMEANIVEDNKKRKKASVREAFATYAPAGPGEKVYMENASTAKVEGYGKIFLKMTSGKVLNGFLKEKSKMMALLINSRQDS